MFIDATRYGGLRILRLAVAAIAYIDAVDGGAAIHLIGGETLRVNEDPAEIELRCMILAEEQAPPEAPPPATDVSAIAELEPAPPATPPIAPASAKRKKDGA